MMMSLEVETDRGSKESYKMRNTEKYEESVSVFPMIQSSLIISLLMSFIGLAMEIVMSGSAILC